MRPANEDALAGDTAQGIQNQTKTDATSVAIAQICGNGDDAEKAFKTLQAQLYRLGYTVHKIDGGGYLIARWDRTLHCSDLGGVRRFYEQIGGAT